MKMDRKKILSIKRHYFKFIKIFNQINRFALLAYLFFLPTQLGKHFFFSFSYLSGVRVDYLAPTLYLNDLIFILIFLLNIRAFKFFLQSSKWLLPIAFLNIFFALSKPVAFYYWIRLLQLMMVFFIFKNNKLPAKTVILIFISSAIIQLFIGLNHLLLGRSLQGVFYFLGERFFNLSTFGIAKIDFFGKEILRAYGTFSHPNSLAGFYLLLYVYLLTEKKFNPFFILKNLCLFVLSCLILISFSKVAIFSFLIINLIYFLLQEKKCLLCHLSKIFIFFVLALIFLQAKGDVLSLSKRLELINNALIIFSRSPFFGVGLGNYLLAQNAFSSKFYLFFNQPVHNIFLLLMAEIGILFFIILTFMVLLFFKRIISKKILTTYYLLLVTIFLTGFFDHYWLTLPQNFFLIGVVFALKLF